MVMNLQMRSGMRERGNLKTRKKVLDNWSLLANPFLLRMHQLKIWLLQLVTNSKKRAVYCPVRLWLLSKGLRRQHNLLQPVLEALWWRMAVMMIAIDYIILHEKFLYNTIGL